VFEKFLWNLEKLLAYHLLMENKQVCLVVTTCVLYIIKFVVLRTFAPFVLVVASCCRCCCHVAADNKMMAVGRLAAT
jgi:hypothetical protein